jgi:uncharacterized protein YmfQ (DUF2313 family)
MNYKTLIRSLFPRGPIWRNINDVFDLFIEALAEEPQRIHNRVLDLTLEAFPATTTEMITEWEDVALLQEEKPSAGDTLAARRGVVLAKITAAYTGQAESFWINYAAKMGILISISKPYAPFRCGIGKCGESLGLDGGVFLWRVTLISDTNSNLAKMQAAFERLKAAETEIEYVIAAGIGIAVQTITITQRSVNAHSP